MKMKFLPVALLAANAFAGIANSPFFSAAVGERVCSAAVDCSVDTPTTNVDDGGYWFDYDDRKNDGGSSFVTYPVEADEYGSYVTPMLTAYGAISITMTAGPDATYPFVGYGFNIVNGAKDGYDIASNWGTGVCITLSNTAKLSMELEYVGDGANTAYDEYAATIVPGTAVRTVTLPFTDFVQAGWGTAVEKTTALANIVAVKLKFAGTTGKTLTDGVVITEFGMSGTCTGLQPTGFNDVKAASSVKTHLVGRTLSFSGITSTASVEVINLQGQVVLKSAVNGASVLNLNKLDAGVYMIRVAGKTLNLNQKVVLK